MKHLLILILLFFAVEQAKTQEILIGSFFGNNYNYAPKSLVKFSLSKNIDFKFISEDEMFLHYEIAYPYLGFTTKTADLEFYEDKLTGATISFQIIEKEFSKVRNSLKKALTKIYGKPKLNKGFYTWHKRDEPDDYYISLNQKGEPILIFTTF